ncbi:MAG: RsmE family RNA methyltransferase [Bacteriovoracales bacterium]|nr:RsmE family RNA methyltransferase [Bacteriovoracales bacterium]
MRAEYIFNLADFDIEDVITLDADQTHHLSHVIRIKKDKTIFLFDGQGLFGRGIIESITHQSVSIRLQSKEQKNRPHLTDLALGVPKKTDFDLSLKIAVELGVNQLIPLKTDFSQKNFIKKERLEKIFISSLKQSNAYFFPKVFETTVWEKIDLSPYDHIFCFSLKRSDTIQKENSMNLVKNPTYRNLIVIGPEGGLSEREEKALAQCPQLFFVNLPSYILKTTTAIPTALGWIFSHISLSPNPPFKCI